MSPSRLNNAQRRFLLVVVVLGISMIADTLYLLANRLAEVLGIGYFAVSEVSLPRFYQVMVLGHTGVGLILVTAALVFAAWHLPAPSLSGAAHHFGAGVRFRVRFRPQNPIS